MPRFSDLATCYAAHPSAVGQEQSFVISSTRFRNDIDYAMFLLAMKIEMRRVIPARLSRMGIILVGIYAFLTAVAVIVAFRTGDFKGHFVFVPLPLALQWG